MDNQPIMSRTQSIVRQKCLEYRLHNPASWRLKKLIDQDYRCIDGCKICIQIFQVEKASVVRVTELESDYKYYFELKESFKKRVSMWNAPRIVVYMLSDLTQKPTTPKDNNNTLTLTKKGSIINTFYPIQSYRGNISQRKLNPDEHKAIIAYKIIFFIANLKKEEFYSKEKSSNGQRIMKSLYEEYSQIQEYLQLKEILFQFSSFFMKESITKEIFFLNPAFPQHQTSKTRLCISLHPLIFKRQKCTAMMMFNWLLQRTNLRALLPQRSIRLSQKIRFFLRKAFNKKDH